jgi:hypothetical protein
MVSSLFISLEGKVPERAFKCLEARRSRHNRRAAWLHPWDEAFPPPM